MKPLTIELDGVETSRERPLIGSPCQTAEVREERDGVTLRIEVAIPFAKRDRRYAEHLADILTRAAMREELRAKRGGGR